MRRPLLVRGLATGVMALGLVGATALPVAAKEVCRDEPRLEIIDGDGDGVATVGEIRALAPDNAELQASADQLDAAGITGIRYTDCDESGSGATGGEASTGSDNGATGSEAGTGSGSGSASGNGATSGTSSNGDATESSASGAGTGGETDDLAISTLPDTGQKASAVSSRDPVAVILGAMSIVILGAAVTLRQRRSV